MCGITGILASRGAAPGVVERMTRTLSHRGPDSSDVWYDREAGIGLGHRRLAILDLSAEGQQPMCSADHRYVIAYNGEVYNFPQLRVELEQAGTVFRGHSDTEVVLEAVAAWGLAATLERLVGMFAFALWDRHQQQLHLVRDRLGIKPLYYGRLHGSWLFGSELKAICAGIGEQPEVNRDALALLLRYGYVPGETTIYRGIYKVEPGHWISLSTKQIEKPQPTRYWSVAAAAEAGRENPLSGRPGDAVEQLHALLREAVGMRMVADVPIGAFLSGGIDSSTVVALMQEQSLQPVKTFSIGFQEAGYDEAVHARAVAQRLGTDHHELYVTSAEAMSVVPRLPTIYDEPFADPSAIPTILLSELARTNVAVSLSGDGGDELFFGYRRYFDAQRLWSRVRCLPYAVRRPLARVLASESEIGSARRRGLLAGMLGSREAHDLYHWRISHWRFPGSILVGAETAQLRPWRVGSGGDFVDPAELMMLHDQCRYLPDDILTKVDRATMSVALEARVPLLDHRVVEFAWRLPTAWKVLDGKGKWPLRQVLYRYFPEPLFDRPKQGFSVPLRQWLRGPLRDWAEALLDPRRLREEGFFRSERVQAHWHEHLTGRHDHAQRLWNVLMFQAWLEQQQKVDCWRPDLSASILAG
ncbi:MAG TPA: asparagine synthase (glutamine-hydrolyzing) [Gammaproteobacteria bacterium]|nr:asparagine synthase (glutamine-hydrolyzing) [Gammaproteobacteria bacterium]